MMSLRIFGKITSIAAFMAFIGHSGVSHANDPAFNSAVSNCINQIGIQNTNLDLDTVQNCMRKQGIDAAAYGDDAPEGTRVRAAPRAAQPSAASAATMPSSYTPPAAIQPVAPIAPVEEEIYTAPSSTSKKTTSRPSGTYYVPSDKNSDRPKPIYIPR